jgi:hypothetical protein
MMLSTHLITVPEVALVAGTRAALGMGLGFLLADRLSPESRKAAGWALVAVGALTTIPLAMEILGQHESQDEMACCATSNRGKVKQPVAF